MKGTCRALCSRRPQKVRRFARSLSSGVPRFVNIVDNTDLVSRIPLEDVRTFSFIAHVDHGKSSLSSRVLELTGNLGTKAQKIAWRAAMKLPTEGGDVNEQREETGKDGREQIELLDRLAVERQRGITVKASTASMLYEHPSAKGPEKVLLINMVDTPGHVDFGREVSRSLSFVQGAVLLLDAAQGIQAQTWSVHEKVNALPNPPELILALTKVDLQSAKPIDVSLSVAEWLDWEDPDDILLTSARDRIGVKTVLDAVCERVPPPQPLSDDLDESKSILRAQVVDSWYDERGVNCLVQILSGKLSEGDRISIFAGLKTGQSSYPVQEVGLVLPEPYRTGSLGRGQLGYVRFGLRDPRQALPGTMLIWNSHVKKTDFVVPETNIESHSQSVLYASVHPTEADGFEELCNAVERLALNDTGLDVQKTSSVGNLGGGPFLGPGLRVGFQGLLHVEVFRQRLEDEFQIEAVVTPPKVHYAVTIHPNNRNHLEEIVTKQIEDLSDWPEAGSKFKVQEPIVDARIVARVDDAGSVMELVDRKRGFDLTSKPIDEEKWLFTAKLPWGEVVTDFHDQLKNATSGYGSMDTSEADPPFMDADLCKVDIFLNSEVVAPLAFVCHSDRAQGEARVVCKKLQEVLPRQQFVTVIQAKADGKIIASERVKAFRKDVLTKSGKTVGGGDVTRKMKLLEKQKKGKKKAQQSGKVTLSQAAFNSVITRSS